MASSPLTFFCPPIQTCLSQHHFKKKLSQQTQYWLRINCGRAFVWEMTYPWESSNILLIKIKIKSPAGQNLELMTFRYLKILVSHRFFNKLQHYLMFLFLNSIIIDNQPLSLWLFNFVSPNTLIPHSFQENWHDHKIFWRFHQIPPPPPILLNTCGKLVLNNASLLQKRKDKFCKN